MDTEKKELLLHIKEVFPDAKQHEIANLYNVSQSTISKNFKEAKFEKTIETLKSECTQLKNLLSNEVEGVKKETRIIPFYKKKIT